MADRPALLHDPRKLLIVIIIAAVLLRLSTSVIFFGNTIQSLPGVFDEVSYHNLAIRVLDGHGFSFGKPWWPGTDANEPTAHWSYLYTLYLAAVYSVFGQHPLLARLIQSVLVGVLMPWLLFRISCRVVANRDGPWGQTGLDQGQKIGLVTAAIAGVYAYFFYYAAALITESFYIVSILWCFDLAIQISQSKDNRLGRWLLLGLALGVTVLLRQLFLLFVPFLLLWLWWARHPRLGLLLLPPGVILVMMLPWTVRNYLAFEQFVPLNTNSGHAFFWGNHPWYGTQFVPILPTAAYYAMIPEDLAAQELNEAAMDAALLKRGIAFVLDDPGRYVLLSLSRIPSYFVFWPSADSSMVSNVSRVGSFGLFLPLMVYGLIRSFNYHFTSLRQRLASPFFLFYLFILIYTAMHVLSWTLIRYRIPVDAILVLFAGIAVVDLAQRIMARRQQLRTTVV